MNKERKGKKIEEKEERRKGKNEKGKGGWPAMVGGHRRRPEMAGDGRKWPEKVAKAPKEKVV